MCALGDAEGLTGTCASGCCSCGADLLTKYVAHARHQHERHGSGKKGPSRTQKLLELGYTGIGAVPVAVQLAHPILSPRMAHQQIR